MVYPIWPISYDDHNIDESRLRRDAPCLLQYVFSILSSIITTLSTLAMRSSRLKVRNAQPEQIIKQAAQSANSLFVQHSRTNRVRV